MSQGFPEAKEKQASWEEPADSDSLGVDIGDVTISGIQNGEALVYSGGVWGNADITISSISDISDVVVTTPGDGEVLTYSSGNWINAAASGGTNIAIQSTAPSSPSVDDLWIDTSV